MALADDLLALARHLATLDAHGRPRQANLRRAVSSAYYAVFHFLIDRGCRFAVGTSRDRRPLRAVLGRAFDHGTMRRVSAGFASGTLPAKLQAALGAGATVPADLRRVADAFRTLQEARHGADYDVLRRFARRETLLLVNLAEEAMRLWPAVQDAPAGRLYLVALLAGDRVRD